MKITDWFEEQGYDISAYHEMIGYIELWKAWHKGYVSAFHDYKIWNGDKHTTLTKRTLNMANQIATDYADLLLNEKVDYNIGDEELTSLVYEQVLEPNNFALTSNRGVELSTALGTGAFVERLEDMKLFKNGNVEVTKDTKIKIDFTTADKIIPLTYSGLDVSECAFLSTEVRSGNKLLIVTRHLLDDKKEYEIHNNVFIQGKDNNLTEIELDDYLPVFKTKSKRPWFHIIRPNIANTINLDSPYGISIYQNALPQLQGVDEIYDGFINEFVMGKKRIMVDESLLKFDENGNPKYDTNDIIYYFFNGSQYDGDGNKITQGLVEIDLSLRINEFVAGFNQALNMLAKKVGLGDDYYSFEQGQVKTAREVVSDNSQLYRSIKKHEIPLKTALKNMFKSILEIGEVHGIGDLTQEVTIQNEDSESVTELAEVSINFDDSIIEDVETIQNRALVEYNAGLISEVEYFMITRNLERQQAEEMWLNMQEDRKLQEEPPTYEDE